MVGLAEARDPMMRHARPPVNKRGKTRADTPLDGLARPSADRRRSGYTGRGTSPAASCRALHQVFTRGANCVHSRLPSPGAAGAPKAGTADGASPAIAVTLIHSAP